MDGQFGRTLGGTRVIELGQGISAAYCTKLMADLGAEVIKVEEPKVGDETRRWGPFPSDQPHREKSGLFLYLNANKLSVTLNLKVATGREILARLAREADIVVENNPPPLMRELALGYDELQKWNPNLIVTSITSFGQSGPYRDYKAYALNTAAAGGTSLIVGEPGREPLAPPLSFGDYQSATLAAVATMGALIARPLLGRGQHVDISDVETWATMHTGLAMHGYVTHNLKRMRHGHRTPGNFPNGILRCKDGFINLVTITGSQWKRFLELVGDGKMPEWYANNPNYSGTYLRDVANKYPEEIEAGLTPWLMARTKEEIFQLCRERDIPVSPVRTMGEVANSEHLRERGYFVAVDHPQAGPWDYPGPPIRFSKTEWRIDRPAPQLGEHNREVYHGRLAYSDEEVMQLERAGVI